MFQFLFKYPSPVFTKGRFVLLSTWPKWLLPVLIVAFMLTICIGAAVQVLDHRRQAILDSVRTVEALADHLAVALDRTGRDGKPVLPRTSEALERALPAWAAGGGRSILEIGRAHV